MKRLAVLGVLAGLFVAACGGGDEAGNDPPATKPAAATPQQLVVASEPTPEQLEARARLLQEIAAGEYDCDCTGAARARDRIRSGKVDPPDPDRLVSALPDP